MVRCPRRVRRDRNCTAGDFHSLRNTLPVNISERLREAIYDAAPRGTAFLHVPKAAGTSLVQSVIAARRPVVRCALLNDMHSPDCVCTDPVCRAGRDHEEQVLAGIRGGGPWLLDLGHWALTVEEAADIPSGMPIVVPLRRNEQRVVSLFRYNVTQYAYGQGLCTVLTPAMTLAWNPRRRNAYGDWFIAGHEHRASVLNWMRVASEMARYVAPDGRTLLWRDWAAAALGVDQRGLFWFHELLPGLASAADPRWPRLARVPVADLGSWLRDAFGAELSHANRSRRELPGLDLASAAAELQASAPDYTAVDREIMELLLS